MASSAPNPAGTASSDLIRVRDIHLTPTFTDGAQWGVREPTPKVQPALVTLEIAHSISQAAANDDLRHTINYSTICKTVVKTSTTRHFSSSEDLAESIIEKCFAEHPQVKSLRMEIVRPKGLPQPASTHVVVTSKRGQSSLVESYSISNLACHPIVGVNDIERWEKQLVRFDIVMTTQGKQLSVKSPLWFWGVGHYIISEVAKTNYLTLEALVTSVAEITRIRVSDATSVTVRGGKPDALSSAEAAEVEITRTRQDFVEIEECIVQPSRPGNVIAAIALGSNVGDRFANIEFALRLMELPGSQYGADGKQPYLAVVDTSFLYETEPMYVTDQPKFINCACLVETNIQLVPLLKFLKEIEVKIGRVKTLRNGPRAIDLDILTYGNDILDTREKDAPADLDDLEGHLVIPHPRIAEREFVLRPLNDLIPRYVHPVSKNAIEALFRDLLGSQPADNPVMNKVIPFPDHTVEPVTVGDVTIAPTLHYWLHPSVASSRIQQETYIMATLNATPDSFSDGSVHNTISSALSYAQSAVQAGASIIDVGGYSTRPGASVVSVHEEIARVLPVISAIRSGRSGAHDADLEARRRRTLISVDTFRWEVAMAAISVGANCINDVYAFTGPAYPVDDAGRQYRTKMKSIARDLSVPVILMHSRGEASANKDYSEYKDAASRYGGSPVIEGVRTELGYKVNEVVKGQGGLRRWLVIVDPGIGFSKTVEGNLDVLRGCASITKPGLYGDYGSEPNPLAGYPILIGASRKSFLGAILAESSGSHLGRQTKPVERGWATAAAVACAVQQKVNVIRVHDVQDMGDVVKVSKLLWP